jgi:hypothetical protein
MNNQNRKPVNRSARRVRSGGLVVLSTLILLTGLGIAPASAGKARWVLVGKELFTIDGESARVPTYVNTGSIVGDRFDTYTVTFQARFAGKLGINRVNVGVVVDCVNDDANSDQFIVYYSAGSDDSETYYGGDISPRIRQRALSYCY